MAFVVDWSTEADTAMNWGIFLILGLAAGALGKPEAEDPVAIIRPPPLCEINEHYESDSNRCQITCENMQYEHVMGACMPTSTCYCNNGYVRNANGTCIKRQNCSPRPPKCTTCPKGEVYNECGSSCPASCENKGNTCLVCTQQCVAGCFCAGGTIRAPDGSCVLPEKCPRRTCSGPNEIFDKCPPTCPRTEECKNIWSKIPCEPIDCCKPQCRCKPGFFRNDKNICVSAQECSNPTPECGPNEVSTDCYNDCQRTCKNRIIGSDKVCAQVCGKTGCVCKPDYLRHDNGTCVPEYECSPADCKKGEVYSDCGSSCPDSCASRGNTCRVCTAQCVPGCYCARNTIRAPDGSCVKPENCPPRKCSGKNEIFDECPPTCPRSEGCSNLWSKIPCTPIDCCEPKCRCKPGFYRDGNNNCISGKQCTAASNPTPYEEVSAE